MEPGMNYRQTAPRPGLEMMLQRTADEPRAEVPAILAALPSLLAKPYDPKRMGAFLDAHMDDLPTSMYLALRSDPKAQRGLYDFARGLMKAREGKYNAQRGYAGQRNEFERNRAHGIPQYSGA